MTGEADEEPPIWEALERGPKTYVEKRSWIAIMLAFRRLIDWHVITFHILVVLAFWKLLAWDYPYALQVSQSLADKHCTTTTMTHLSVPSPPPPPPLSCVRPSPLGLLLPVVGVPGQLMSSFFLVLSLLAILWVSLEVWMACQGTTTTPDTIGHSVSSRRTTSPPETRRPYPRAAGARSQLSVRLLTSLFVCWPPRCGDGA